MRDEYNLQRFMGPQDQVYAAVLDELRAGEKRGHWMWYIFPQVKGLGHSVMAQKFAITSQKRPRHTSNTLFWVQDLENVQDL